MDDRSLLGWLGRLYLWLLPVKAAAGLGLVGVGVALALGPPGPDRGRGPVLAALGLAVVAPVAFVLWQRLRRPVDEGGPRPRYTGELGRALREAFGTLTSPQRNALRLHFIEGLTDEKIGALLRVHRTTVTRWIDAAREQLLGETMAEVGRRLRRLAALRRLLPVLAAVLAVLAGLVAAAALRARAGVQ